jgi:hypoxanthine-DNA glycosylase
MWLSLTRRLYKTTLRQTSIRVKTVLITAMEIETHPHKPFVPAHAEVLIVGSFPGKDQVEKTPETDDWFYGTKRNQFWKIMSGVYEKSLDTRIEKEALFTNHHIAIADVFLKIRRKNNNNMDDNLEILEYNTEAIQNILIAYPTIKIFFTSRFVEQHFYKMFPAIQKGICLPSPSPRYARMSLTEKIRIYKQHLPE